MKLSILASLIVAALGSTAALAQSQPNMPDATGPGLSAPPAATDDGSATAGSSLERSSQSYDSGNSGRGAAGRPYDSGTSDGMAGDSAAGAPGSALDNPMPMDSARGSTMAPDSTSSPQATGTSEQITGSGAAGRPYDGSTASGPASRADVAADRDRALRSERWIFNDLDGVRRLDPGESSHTGRVYKGSADNY